MTKTGMTEVGMAETGMTEMGVDPEATEEEQADQWAMMICADGQHVPDPLAVDQLGPHQAAFSVWVAQDPARKARYLKSTEAVMRAGSAAGQLGMRSRPLEAASQAAASPARRIRSPMLLAASLALGLIVAAGLFWRTADTAPLLIPQSAAQIPLETRVGEVRTEHLADGTSVLLDTDTLLLVSMTAERRSVAIKRGRARFFVPRDDGRPFIVHGAGTSLRSDGGSFDVMVRDTIRINPIVGTLAIEFSRALPSDQSSALLLPPGKLLSFAAGQGSPVSVIAVPRSEQQWVDGVKSFDNVPIHDVIAEANSYSETKIELADPALGNREIFADIDIRNIDRVAQALAAFLDLSIDRSQKNRLILKDAA
ncbi:FecR family protein [Sphingobium sp. YR768]|nr:FecR family protein [Sphingobium sp. YR768]